MQGVEQESLCYDSWRDKHIKGKCILSSIKGDFNAHFERLEGKMSGNYADVYDNIHLLISFIRDQNLRMVNQLGDQTNVFTRREYEYKIIIKTQS